MTTTGEQKGLPITALGPNDPDDGNQGRQMRGVAIAAIAKIERNRIGYQVPSQSGNGTYIVSMDGEPFCSCPDFATRGEPCKHVYAVEYVIQRETQDDGSEKYTESVQVTYRNEWTVYNKAQTNEEALFVRLLKDLCEGVPQPVQTNGRPRLPLNDVLFALGYKVYSTKSGRRFTTALKEAQATGLIDKAPHYNSAFRYLEDPELTPLLKALIEESANPLSVLETDFAVDSTGFSASVYNRWFDHKYGKMRSENKWVKAHLICGVTTNIVTSIKVTPTETADAPQLPELVDSTAKRFDVREVSADKAYSSHRNLHAIQAVNGTPYIMFKKNATGKAHRYKPDPLWNYMMAYYNRNREAFLQHYNKRSNAESTMWMIKSKFGGSVRSKTPTAQVNEVLLKALCHNICVLIQSIFELGLEPVFWEAETFEAKQQNAPKLLHNLGV